MSAEPWKKWTPEEVSQMSDHISGTSEAFATGMLRAFSAILKAEQRGERCVLPREVAGKEMDTMIGSNGDWRAWLSGSYYPEGKGNTQEAAILDFARKLRGE